MCTLRLACRWPTKMHSAILFCKAKRKPRVSNNPYRYKVAILPRTRVYSTVVYPQTSIKGRCCELVNATAGTVHYLPVGRLSCRESIGWALSFVSTLVTHHFKISPLVSPYIIPVYRSGWRRLASVGNDWRRHSKTFRSLRELDNQSTWYRFLFFFLGGLSPLAFELDDFLRGGEPLLCTRRMVVSRSTYGRAPTRQLHSSPNNAASGSGHTGK